VAPLLLDTCAVLWIANGERILEDCRRAVDEAAPSDQILISPITAWEIGTLVRKGRIALSMPPEAWFDAALALPGVRLAPMPPRTLIASAFLPGTPPADPADRIIAATARTEGFVLVTRDQKLLSYGNEGHVRVLAC
jgi:PIN domain nuclease of toxin-antitoxin system